MNTHYGRTGLMTIGFGLFAAAIRREPLFTAGEELVCYEVATADLVAGTGHGYALPLSRPPRFIVFFLSSFSTV